MRILHVLGKLDRGGVETWLVQLLAQLDRKQYQCDFLVHTDAPGAYDSEVKRLGANVISCLSPHTPLVYARRFLDILRRHGPYDVVHSHVHYFSGYVLALARLGGVPVRIAHSHTDMRLVEQSSSITRRFYRGAMKTLLSHTATGGFAVSSGAGDSLFPKSWYTNDRWKLAYLGIDLSRFSGAVDGAAARRELGLDEASMVIGHVGRVDDHKNQKFTIDIAAELLKIEPGAMFLLVGEGPRFQAIKQEIKDRGLSDYFVLPGQRCDVPRLMRAAMDLFLFPSIREGLPITLLEAQAAGLPCLVSDRVTPEAEVIPELVTWKSLSESATKWAQSIALLAQRPRLSSELACSRMQTRSIHTSRNGLLAAYQGFAAHVG